MQRHLDWIDLLLRSLRCVRGRTKAFDLALRRRRPRTTRRWVAESNRRWRRRHGRRTRPWIPEPGLWMQGDYGNGPMVENRSTVLFCAWLAWSRFRVVLPLPARRCRAIVGNSPHAMYGERLSTRANQSPRLRITPDNRTEPLCCRAKTKPVTARASGSGKATDAGRVLASVLQGAKPPRQALHRSAGARSRARERSSEPLGGSCEPEPTRRLGDRVIRSARPAQVRDARRGQACGVSLRRPTASLRAGRVRCLSPRAAPRAHRRRGQTRRLR
jgi:hypothetical protein